MARLYTVTESDSRRTPATAGARQRTDTLVYWGDAHNPKPLIQVFTVWDNGTDTPIVIVKAIDPNAKFCYYRGGQACWQPEPYEEEAIK